MFKTFPEFSKLTLNDRKEYEAYVKDFPPTADISFASLMTWWNSLNQAAVSVLNDNLVVSYWMPEFESEAGLALIGINQVDESLCVLFDYLVGQGQRVRSVFVPEFVVGHIRYPELFNFKAQRKDYEYILALSKYANLEEMTGWKRQKIEKQLQKVSSLKLELRPLDFGDPVEYRIFFEASRKWWKKNINYFGSVEWDAMKLAVQNYSQLGLESIALFIEGHLQGFCIYFRSHDSKYVTVHFIKATGSKMLKFELIGHLFAKHLFESGVQYVNINTDVGNLPLRMFMLTLGPTDFFRKYTIEPA